MALSLGVRTLVEALGLAACVWPLVARAGPPGSPPTDPDAIREAASFDEGGPGSFASSEAYRDYLMGALAADRGDPSAAIERYRKVLALDPEATHVRVRMGQAFAALGSADRAEESLREATARDPRSAEAHAALGELLLGRLRSAGRQAETRVEIGPACARVNLFDQAIAQLDRAIELQPGASRWRYDRGVVELDLGRAGAAAADLAAVPLDDDLYVDAQARRGAALEEAGRPVEAEAGLLAALRQRPGAAALYVALAQLYVDEGKGTLAVALLEGARARVANDAGAASIATALAGAYEAVGRGGAAIDLLRQLLTAEPANEAVLLALAGTLDRQGHAREAMSLAQQALDRDPRDALALNFLGFTLAERGERLADAERLTDLAVQIQPDNGLIVDSLGWVYFKRGKLPLALRTLRRAVALSPGEPVILEHLGDACIGSGELGEGAASYRAALAALGQSGPAPLRKELEQRLREAEGRIASLSGSP